MRVDMGCVRAGGSTPEQNGAVGSEPKLSPLSGVEPDCP